MASRNVELYRLTLDAFNRRDKDAWMTAVDPEMENHPPPDWPETRPTKGAEAVWDFLISVTDIWEDARFETDGPVVEGDDTVLAHLRGEVAGQASGAEVLWSYHHVITFRDGKPIRADYFADRADAMEAAGLSPEE